MTHSSKSEVKNDRTTSVPVPGYDNINIGNFDKIGLGLVYILPVRACFGCYVPVYITDQNLKISKF